MENAVLEQEVAVEIGNGAAGVAILGRAEGVPAERLQLFAKSGAAPFAVVDRELAVENHLFDDAFRTRSNDKFCFDLDGAGKQRLVRIDGEFQEVLDASIGDRGVDGDEVTFFRYAYHLADSDDQRMLEGGVDRMEIRISVRAIDGRGKIRLE